MAMHLTRTKTRASDGKRLRLASPQKSRRPVSFREAGAGHAFAQTAFLDEGALQVLELAIE